MRTETYHKTLGISCSNYESTNMFESLLGALNIAPTKISGQYKIVIDKNNKLWLDDYTGRRVAIDLTVSFLQQVSNFLQVEQIIAEPINFRYGGFQRSTIKSFHIPFYFGSNRFPKYFLISRVPNETIHEKSYDVNGELVDENSDVYELKYPFKYGEILKVVDLEKLGIKTIIDEINSEDYFDYPLYFNWEDNNIKIYGYGIEEGYPIVHTLELTNNMSNQPYIDVLNNKILNTYVEKKMFYPRFLNIELEFDYDNEYNHFNNFMGYLGEGFNFGEGFKPELLFDTNFYIKIKEYNNEFYWKQINYFNDYTLEKYLDLLADGTINEINERNPQFRFMTYRVQPGDVIKINNEYYDDILEYTVSEKDIIPESLLQTWIKICYNLTKLSGRNYIFNCYENENYVIITIENNFGNDFDEYCTIELPTYFKILDRFENSDNSNKFRGITENDIWLCGQPNLMNNVNTLGIYNENNELIKYNIVEKFKFGDETTGVNGYTILRLDKPANIKKLTRAYIYQDKIESVVLIDPINFLTVYSTCKSELPFNFQEYRKNLKEKFLDNYVPTEDVDEELRKKQFEEALKNFNKEFEEPLYQYVEDNDNGLNDKSELTVEKHNEELIKNILFCSMGCTTYMIPNLLNIDKQCWVQNGCVDSNLERNDKIRFNWFLINGECPEYLKNSINSLRYMERIIVDNGNPELGVLPTYKLRPKITSRLIRLTDSLCETIFLGVKYQLPIQYENYDFCVYLNFNNQKDGEMNYNFEIFPEENLLMLSINKYLDFNDLIRGGNDKNEPLIDLSFFYNINNASNLSSDYLFAFKTCGIKLEPFYDSEDFQPLWNGKPQKNWRLIGEDGKHYFVIQREFLAGAGSSNSFKLLFPTSGNAEFYVYSKIKYKDVEYQYISMTLKIINIKYLEDDYLWCEDLKVKFFDTKQIFLHRLKKDTDLSLNYRNPDIEEILMVDKKNIISLVPVNDNEPWGNNHKIATIIVDNNYEKFELLLPDKEISFKEEYFEIIQSITENADGSKNYFKEIFIFPEFNLFNDTILKETLLNIINDSKINNYELLYNYKKVNSLNDIIDRFDDGRKVINFVPTEDYDKSVYYQMMNLFNRNQIWRIIQDVLYSDLKFKFLTEDQIRYLLDDFTVGKLKDYTNYTSLQIINRSESEWNNINYVDEYIKLNVIDIDKNIVIWPIENKPKVSLINRHRTAYIPYLEICKNIFDFQIDEFKKYGTVWNIYDEKFGGIMIDGTPISATGIWKEVKGNIISSLFCKEKEIKISIGFKTDVDYRDLLISITKYEECIITNDNEKYISSLNKNQQKYIIESYVDMLLQNFYKLDYVENELGMKLNYTVDSKKLTLLHFENKDKYGSISYNGINFNNLIFVFNRK